MRKPKLSRNYVDLETHTILMQAIKHIAENSKDPLSITKAREALYNVEKLEKDLAWQTKHEEVKHEEVSNSQNTAKNS